MDKKLIVFGTRPEFIKLVPVFEEIKKQNTEKDYLIIFTGQHAELINDLFELFNFYPTFTLPGTNHHNSLCYSFSGILVSIQNIIGEIQKTDNIKMIIAQGDTTSCVCAAMCAFFNSIPFGHIEAGLRTKDLANPFPEEYFRKIISLTSTIHFAPTERALENLLREGISKKNIVLTGNTIVDAIELIKSKIKKNGKTDIVGKFLIKKNNILITCHRRENQNKSFNTLIESIKILAVENPSLNFIWISHKTPFTLKELSKENFKNQPNIYVLSPVNVLELYHLYHFTKIIITDSGGIQEEAPGFNIPVIVIRRHTERNESIDKGYSLLTRITKKSLVSSFNILKNQPAISMINPYGDGKAAQRIVDHLKKNY